MANKNQYNFNRNRKPHKKSSHPLLSILFGMFLVWGITYALIQIRSGNSDESYIPFEVSSDLNDVTGKIVFYDKADSPSEKEDIWVLYQGLSDADKIVYDLFLDLAKNRDGDDYTSAIIISHEKMEELDPDHLWNVYYAMCYDHPEYFYLFTGDEKIHSTFSSYDNYEVHYYTMEKPNEEDAELENNFRAATKEFFKGIDMDGSDEEIELAIHDKLIDTVNYDYEILEDNHNDGVWELGDTAYGALVCDSEGRPNHAICGGYSFAFEYLLHEAGIPCAYVSGSAMSIPPSDDDQPSHAWNVVKIGEKWYEVDTTWDDQEYEEGEYDEFFASLENYEDKYDNLLHHYYNKTTAEMEDLKATEDTLFYVDGYSPYNAVNDSSHVRAITASDDSNPIEIFVNSLIPIAE